MPLQQLIHYHDLKMKVYKHLDAADTCMLRATSKQFRTDTDQTFGPPADRDAVDIVDLMHRGVAFVSWVRDTYCRPEWDAYWALDALQSAARMEDIDIQLFEWLWGIAEVSVNERHDVAFIAAEEGNLDVLRWFQKNEPLYIMNEYMCAMAASGGHIKVLGWLRQYGCPWEEDTCCEAAEAGHLDVLKWLRNQDPPCPWDESACYAAAYMGHLDVLKWLRETSAPWHQDGIRQSAYHQNVIDWLDSI